MIKSTLTALCALLIGGTAMAAIPDDFEGKVMPRPHGPIQGCNGLKVVVPAQAPSRLPGTFPVINEVEGTRMVAKTTGTGYYVAYNNIIDYYEYSVANEVVYGENDEVYFYNLLPFAATYTYIKGTKQGDKVVVKLPQTVYNVPATADEEEYSLNLALCTYNSTYDTYFDSKKDEVTFTIQEDGTMVSDLGFGGLLGYVYSDTNSWAGYGASSLTVTTNFGTATTLPEGLEADPWALFVTDTFGYKVKVAIDGVSSEAYLGGIIEGMPDFWVKGSLSDDGNTICLTAGQYLGIYNIFFTYLEFGEIVGYDEYDSPIVELMPKDYVYKLKYDDETGTLAPVDPEILLLFNRSEEIYRPTGKLSQYTIAYQEDYDGTPANPRLISYGIMYARYILTCLIPTVSQEGTLLDSSCLSYLTYIDDDIYEFEADEYGLPETMTEIPFDMSTAFIYAYKDGIREIHFFIEGISKVGVQSVYRYNGEETFSEISSFSPGTPDGLNDVTLTKEIAEEAYFDLAGRAVANPENGLYIKRTTFTDGTTVSVKKAIR